MRRVGRGDRADRLRRGAAELRVALEQYHLPAQAARLDRRGQAAAAASDHDDIGFKMARIPVVRNLLTYLTPHFMVRASIENDR